MNETVSVENTTAEDVRYPVLFYMSLKGLINAKSTALFELRTLEKDLLNLEHDYLTQESEILLRTDFKELGLTNEKMRKAYLNDQLFDEKCDIDIAKGNIESKKDTIEIINHLIKVRELEMKGE